MTPTFLIRAFPHLLAVAAVGAALGVSYHAGSTHTETKYELLMSKERERNEQAIATEMAERLRIEQAARAAEQAKQNEIEEIRKDASHQIARATSDAASAAASAASLREQAKRAAARCAVATTASAGTSAGGAPTSAPGMVLADVLARIDARAGELAQYADRAAIAGAACEISYDAPR